MESLTNYTDKPMEWLQPKAFARAFELRSGEAQLATLVFRSAFGTLASADTTPLRGAGAGQVPSGQWPEGAEDSWTFKRVGFLNPRVNVRRAGSEVEVAVYTPRLFSGGTLVVGEGPSLGWESTNFWATQWRFTDPGKNPIVRFTSGRENSDLSDIFKSQATVHVEPATAYRAWLPLLVTLGMYLLVLQTDDTAATVSATSVASAG